MKGAGTAPFPTDTVVLFTLCLLLSQYCVTADEDDNDLDAVYPYDNVENNCDEPPPPLHGIMRCSIHKKKSDRYVCKAECDPGYQLPNKKTKGKRICDLKTGEWSPKYEFPDCEPICDPPCENRGKCLEGNHCICTPKYRGDRCQYALELCDPEKGLGVSAQWQCEDGPDETTCVMKCPQGTRYESPPADKYHCSLAGTWTPSFAPKCTAINVFEPPTANGMYSPATNQMISSALPNSGVCAVWGTSHYRTFDGGIYSFQGPCAYLLSEDCEQNTFAIHIRNAEPCDDASTCSTTLAIYVGSELFLLTRGQGGGPVVENGGDVHPIPGEVNGLLFQLLSDYVTVKSSLGFSLKWNRKNTVLLKANNQLRNRTCGLCGKFDGSVLNDFETPGGSITDSVEGFVNSWTRDNLGERCEGKAVVRDACSENKEKAAEAEKLCSAIMDIKFSACHKLVDPKIYFEICKMEHCACPFGSCYCGTLAEYFRECSRLGGKLAGGWRSDELCPLSCPEGMIYKDCGTSCPRTCKGTLYDCEDNQCLDGCHCPDGMLLHLGRCLEKRDCPCMHSGKEHSSGETIKDGCNACECTAGEWVCTSEKCEATCISSGDPHYTTFDGLKYDFYGSCSYYLVYNDNFTVVQEIGPCSGSEPGTEGMYCTSKVSVTYLDETLLLQPDNKVTLNEKDVHLPISASRISASIATDLFLKVDLTNGLNVLWDGRNRIYVNAPPSLYDQTAGLCGTFNNKQKDDFLTPTRDVEDDASAFAARWEVSGSCHKRSRRGTAPVPCEYQPQKLKDAELLCASLKMDVFKECHAELDPASYYKSCVSDLCHCTQDLTECLCPIIADYSLACTKKGIVVNWVEEITPCKKGCAGGQVYQECGNPCTSSCLAIAYSDMCIQQCVQGCACPEGTALNDEGFCIAVDQCPCLYEDKEYLPSSVTVQESSICTCQGADWQCRPGTLAELAALNPASTIGNDSLKCLEENHEEYTQCRESCPKTCQNRHIRAACKTEECKPGCRCKDGYLFDSETNKCAKESECGCVHGSQRYREGEIIKQACNLCTCSDGAWQCTSRECPGVCSVWGESHFKTFDGQIFDFHGDCEYMLSKGTTKDTSYSLSVQNVPCGTSGITCSKSFTLELGALKIDRGDIEEVVGKSESLTLSRDEPVPRTSLQSRFVVVESGLFVTVFTDVGLSLQWDRGTRIYVTAEPRWRGRLVGLCGNFNDDRGDDFLTPSGGIPEARSSLFAESWKIHEFCPQPQTVEDACEIHPHRKSWAQQKCGILKSEAFSACHSEVQMEPYYERCVFDSCACDMGGDCECLCTAVAAYAQECNMHGVPVKWRSQQLCPIQCEECATYDSCMSSCPKRTCENGLMYKRIENACSSEFCVEGCNPKPCPEGQIYNNGKEFKCIPEIECVVPCMELNGKLYNEGDHITDTQVVDACQNCHCVRGSIRCIGRPCVDTEPLQPCFEGGWTPWVNTPAFVGGDEEALTDPRLKVVLQNYCGIANMTEIECRVAATKKPYTDAGQRVQCRLPLGLSCKDEDQKDTACEDYEIRVFCDCGPVPTTEPTSTVTVTEPMTLPPVCDQTGWTAWMSTTLPSERGEFETLDRLRVNHYFCEEGMIEDIECRDRSSWKLVTGEDAHIVCNKKVGLVCQGPGCQDYEVRVYCNCGTETKTAPVPVCVTGWTEYFNTDHPDVSQIGDDESLDRIRSLHEFCVGGTIEDIECKAIINGKLTDYKELDTFGLKCSKNVGFQCNQFVRPRKCEDFSVRFFCACEPVIEPTHLITTSTTTPVPITPVPLECGWTPWINTDSPDFERGDIEDLTKIQMLYKTCGGKDLVDIECRMARTLHKYSDSLQNNLICNTEQGFRCLNDDQIGKCHDYEVRLLCMYPWCYPPTTTPVPTTTTANPCPEGKVYDLCAFPCDRLCSPLADKLSEDCLRSPDGCVAGCRPVEGCEPPKMWRDYYTCVSKEDCFCTATDENGTQITVAPNEVITNGCERCQCLENSIKCHEIPGCGVTEVTGVPRLMIIDIVQEDCWTSWINLDKPSNGGGDLEAPNRIRNVYEYCQDPVKIECRTAISHQKPFDVGQIVTCNVHDGLICWNKDNKPEECYDYEIRFFCPCPSQTTTTVAPLPTLPPGPCLFGWTDWYNSHAPDGRGDYETIHSSRISNSFCSNDMISAIQCRQVGKNIGELQSGVICDLEVGLLCNSERLFGSEQCSDYEVRFFCDCPTMAPVTETETLPPVSATAPARKACSYWSDWINENHPSPGGEGVKEGKGLEEESGSGADFEKVMILRLNMDYGFCREGYLSGIECREADTDKDYTRTGDKKLACNLAAGFRCRGKDQPSQKCKDYKIRYFCSCDTLSETTSTSTTTVKSTAPEITVPPCNEFYKFVDGPSPLPDSRLKASSSRDTSSGPQSARLSSEYNTKSAGAWIARKHNMKQFIEIDLGQIQPVYGVITKGRSGHVEWVKSYKVLYSRDGNAYHYVRDHTGEKVFTGNYDGDSEVKHMFVKPFEARFVRIQPLTFQTSIAMRVDILGCASDMEVFTTPTALLPCNDEMGMFNGSIRDYQISTSSNRNWSTAGRYARLNTPQTEDHTGGWVADVLDDEQFIQVNFLEPRTLTGVKTQGRDMVPQWVKAFRISYSRDGKTWNEIKDEDGSVMIFPGNYDSSTTVITYFPRPIRALLLRIHPVYWENWIAMRFEVLGCYKPVEEEIQSNRKTTPNPIIVSDVCSDKMGFENYSLPDTLISVSSSSGPYTGASRIRLNTHQEGLLSGGWIPAKGDYMPRVYVDFYEVRNLTGIITQGLEEDNRWVVSYKVAYSLDNVTWEFAVDKENKNTTFSGNVDRNGEMLRLFDKMITARFLEIIILDYHNLPALRMEVLGCYVPYPVYTPPPVLPTTTEICVEYGPWVSLSDPASSSYGDEEPIDHVIAASGICRNPFEIECRTQVTKKDYSETGQVVTCDLSKGLLCKNAHQPSYQCYNYEVRIKCWTCGVTESTALPLLMCPEIPFSFNSVCPESCPAGFACDGVSCVPSTDCPCFKDGKRFEPSNVAITGDCHQCECVIGGHSRCEPIQCPDCLPGQKAELDSSCHCGCVGCATGTLFCPTSGECIREEQWCDGVQDCPDDETGCPTLPPTTTTVLPTTTTEAPFVCSTDYVPGTSTCEMLSNVFDTFDGQTYQYDVCDHVLMTETSSGLYSVSVSKLCSSEGVSFCHRHLIIEVDGVIIKIGPGLEDITVKDTKVSLDNLWLVARRFPDFEIKKRGNSIVFRSFKYNFDVRWDALQDARITVSKCLMHNIVGLCGLYNKHMNDDLTKPNGAIASGSQEFGDSWAIGSVEKCAPPKCSQEAMKTAIDVCDQLREDPFNSCSGYLKIENRIEACITFMCECVQRSLPVEVTPSKDVLYDFLGADTCKCQAYESFVEACETSKQSPVQEWRIKHDCSPHCPEGMEWQDCGPGCELTCDNYHQRSEICGSACVPGCYCPPGLVRHHNRCVKPKMCQDCVCRGHGDPNYISFDGQYYAFQGVCTYVLVQYQESDNEMLNFRVLATNVECPEEPHTSCTQGLTIFWNGHIIEKFKNKPVFLNKKPLGPEDSPVEYDGITITYVPNKSTLIHIKEINLAVRYFDQMYGFNVELPAFFYFNKTEGLCGICNFIQSDDMYHREGYVTDNVEDFAYSWLVDPETRANCELTRVEVPEPPPPGICNFTTSPCEIFLDPSLYSKSCQNDVAYSRKPEASVCRSKFQFAQQCCERGVALEEWLKLSGCESTCPEGMVYECSSACQRTCNNYKDYREDDCSLMPLYTCACPEGKVLKLGKCVDEIRCEVCDARGHVVGDTWQDGPCKTCECLPDLSVNCVVMECPLPPLCDDKETLQKLERSAEECCDAYLCMPLNEQRCPERPHEECPPGEAYVRDYEDGCAVFRCKCIPDLCPPLIAPFLEEGENYTLSEVDCCKQFKVVCDPDLCAPPPRCSPGFKLSTYEGRCCNRYACVPRNDVCVYRHKYDVVNGTQLDLPLEGLYDVEYKPGSSWQDGLCRKCSCVEINGQFTYSCKEEVCPNPNDFPDAEKYYREEIRVPGSCCSKYRRTACVVEGTKYGIGEEWPSPEGNPCKSYRCNLDKNDEAIVLEKTTICDRTCPQYAVYVESSPGSGKCCGMCKPIACEEDGHLYENGDTWISTSKPCFTAECSVTENGTRITYRGESCPIMPDNCAPENVRSDPKGCCTYCKIPTDTCSAVEVPVYETRGFFGYVDKQRGFCANDQVLRGLTKCGGQCSTESHYSDLIGDFHSVCNCCLPKESQNRTIVLDCEDGSKVEKIYMQPISCQCLACSGNNRYLDALNKVVPYRK